MVFVYPEVMQNDIVEDAADQDTLKVLHNTVSYKTQSRSVVTKRACDSKTIHSRQPQLAVC